MRSGTPTRLLRLSSVSILPLVLGLGLTVLLLAPGREVLAVELNVLAAGAVEAIVKNMVATFEKESGNTVKLTFAPVGALRDKIVAGEPADLTVVTPVIIEQAPPLPNRIRRSAVQQDSFRSEGWDYLMTGCFLAASIREENNLCIAG